MEAILKEVEDMLQEDLWAGMEADSPPEVEDMVATFLRLHLALIEGEQPPPVMVDINPLLEGMLEV